MTDEGEAHARDHERERDSGAIQWQIFRGLLFF